MSGLKGGGAQLADPHPMSSKILPGISILFHRFCTAGEPVSSRGKLEQGFKNTQADA